MRAGTHAREDGSFGRSAGAQTMKGAILIAVALLIGFVLLRTAPKNTTITTGSGVGPTATTKAPGQHQGSSGSGTTLPTSTTAPTAHPANQVTIIVANGAGVAGLAGKIRGQLNAAGYNTSKPAVNAPSQLASSVIYYEPGYQADGFAVATTLSLPQSSVMAMPSPPPVPATQLTGVNLLVIAGADIGGGGGSTNTTEAPPGQTIAPSPTTASSGTSSGSSTTIVHHTTTTIHRTTTTVAQHPSTTVARHPATTVAGASGT